MARHLDFSLTSHGHFKKSMENILVFETNKEETN
jgi:hypothetical protein